jgi:hypothetical protein
LIYLAMPYTEARLEARVAIAGVVAVVLIVYVIWSHRAVLREFSFAYAMGLCISVNLFWIRGWRKYISGSYTEYYPALLTALGIAGLRLGWRWLWVKRSLRKSK